MEIIVCKNISFCNGVKRAILGAMENKDSYCLGEIVHNEEVINDLTNKGIRFIDNIDNVNKEDTVLIRAHGVAKEIYEDANKKGIILKDYTCPNVLRIHEIVKEYNNYFIILTGSRNHPENIGTVSYANNYYILSEIDDIANLLKIYKENNYKDVLLLSQTTFNLEKFMEIRDILKKEIPNIVIKNTICRATEIRQKEVSELSKNVDLMIIIGSKNSSNTNKLYEIASKNTKTVLIDKVSELEDYDYERIGISSGSSTPQEVIDKVIKKLKKYK